MEYDVEKRAFFYNIFVKHVSWRTCFSKFW